MVMTNYAKQAVTWMLGSNIDYHIASVGIGTGSSTPSVTDTTLVTEVDRVVFTTAPDFSVARKVGFQGDFNSVQMSGTILTEFGFFASGATGIGSVYWREGFGSIVFDGTAELQVLGTAEIL